MFGSDKKNLDPNDLWNFWLSQQFGGPGSGEPPPPPPPAPGGGLGSSSPAPGGSGSMVVLDPSPPSGEFCPPAGWTWNPGDNSYDLPFPAHPSPMFGMWAGPGGRLTTFDPPPEYTNKIYGSSFGDTYTYSSSMGLREIQEDNLGGTDTVVMSDIPSTSVTWSRVSGHINISVSGTVMVRLIGQTSNSTGRQIESAVFSDGVTVTRAQMLTLAP